VLRVAAILTATISIDRRGKDSFGAPRLLGEVVIGRNAEEHQGGLRADLRQCGESNLFTAV